MKIQNLLFLVLFFVSIGCGKEDTPVEEEPMTTSYTVTFRAVVCDQDIDVNCDDEASKTAAPQVQILLYETALLRDLGQQQIAEGVTDINGYIGFTGLEAKDYFYAAIHSNPAVVQEAVIQHHVRISPNTPNMNEEVIYLP